MEHITPRGFKELEDLPREGTGAWVLICGNTEFNGDTREGLETVRQNLLKEKKTFSVVNCSDRGPKENSKGYTVYSNGKEKTDDK